VSHVRRQEACRVAEELGIPHKHLHFLGGEDGDLENSRIRGKLRSVFKEVVPDTLFLPTPMDTHKDHIAAAKIVADTLEIDPSMKEQLQHLRVYLYDVQSPTTWFYANRILGIASVAEKKRELLSLYRSQNNLMDFAGEMDVYYGILFDKGPAEVYIETDLSRFILVTEEHHHRFKKKSRNLIQHSGPMTLRKSHEIAMEEKKLLMKYHSPGS